jgi:hypothetical protein
MRQIGIESGTRKSEISLKIRRQRSIRKVDRGQRQKQVEQETRAENQESKE